MEQYKSKADTIRENLIEIKTLRQSGKSLKEISDHFKPKLGFAMSLGQLDYLIKGKTSGHEYQRKGKGGMHTAEADKIRENMAGILELRKQGKTLEEIITIVSPRLGFTPRVNQLWGIMKRDGVLQPLSNVPKNGSSVPKSGSSVTLHLTPERIDVLNTTGHMHFMQNGITYYLEAKKWCCKELRKYSRYRGKVVATFRACPFCKVER